MIRALRPHSTETMLQTAEFNQTTLLCWMLMFMVTGRILGTLEGEDGISSCEPGYYCPRGSLVPVPCPSGTFGPLAEARSSESCISCPPHHYGPQPGLTTCRPCGPMAHQDQPGQNHCVCQGEGQRFQPSDGRCVCSLGYTPQGDENVCVPSVYEICRGSQTRGQHGDCLSSEEWRQHCSQQVCQSPEDSEGFDETLGLCMCSLAFGRGEVCGPWCEGWAPHPAAWLVCADDLRLLYGDTSLQASVPTRVLYSLLKPWTWQESLMCARGVHFSHDVYLVWTTESGFVGVVNAAPEDVRHLFQETLGISLGPSTPPDGTESLGSASEEEGPHWARWSKSRTGNYSRVELLNPTTCLHLGDILLFSVTPEHHPQYDRDNLYNTNEGFDWGPFRSLAQDMSVKGAPPGLFLVLFHEPGVYAFKLSSNPHKHMFVKVMPSGGQCYEVGPFFPTNPHHVTRMGISRKRNLLLHPDWPVIWGLLAGAALMLGMCVTLLALFREYGWPQKVPIPVRYRVLQLRYSLDDYSSKGSSVAAMKKVHRNLRASESESTAQTGGRRGRVRRQQEASQKAAWGVSGGAPATS